MAVVILLSVATGPALAQAQAPAASGPPVPDWTGSAGAGLSVTSGNSSTSTFNLSFDAKYDQKQRNIVKVDGLYLRSTGNGQVTADRTAINARDDYSLTAHLYAFGQAQYLRDTFKDIDYLVAPTAGLGVNLVATTDTQVTLDTSAGVIWEKDALGSLDTSGAVAAGQKLIQTLSGTASLTESVAGLWKTQDFSDALYTFRAGVTASLTARSQLKVEMVDTFKNLPPAPSTKRNDVALVVSILFKL
jgi:putative salt-induced outer membrane protein YdiY